MNKKVFFFLKKIKNSKTTALQNPSQHEYFKKVYVEVEKNIQTAQFLLKNCFIFVKIKTTNAVTISLWMGHFLNLKIFFFASNTEI